MFIHWKQSSILIDEPWVIILINGKKSIHFTLRLILVIFLIRSVERKSKLVPEEEHVIYSESSH